MQTKPLSGKEHFYADGEARIKVKRFCGDSIQRHGERCPQL